MDLTWILVALSLAGNYFVVQKNVVGQWLWAIANVGWVTHFVTISEVSSATLFSTYFFLSVWGIISWSKPEKEPATEALNKGA